MYRNIIKTYTKIETAASIVVIIYIAIQNISIEAALFFFYKIRVQSRQSQNVKKLQIIRDRGFNWNAKIALQCAQGKTTQETNNVTNDVILLNRKKKSGHKSFTIQG